MTYTDVQTHLIMFSVIIQPTEPTSVYKLAHTRKLCYRKDDRAMRQQK